MSAPPAARGRALVLAPFSPEGLEALGGLLPVTYEPWTETGRLADPQELAARLEREGVAVLIVEADFLFAEVFQAAPSLRLVGVSRHSLDHVDVAAATEAGVLVVHAPGRNARAVAEHTLGLALALARGTAYWSATLHAGGWEHPVAPYVHMLEHGVELEGRTLGLVGLGHVGRLVARLGRALGMAVLACDPYAGPVGARRHGALLAPLEEVLRRADVLSLHAAATPETQGLLDARRLALLKPTAYVINTATPSLLDHHALADALRAGRLAGAALDVHDAHPLPPDSPLLGLESVVLTPHIAGATRETVARHSRTLTEEVARYLTGRRPRHLANPHAWRRRRR